MQQHVVENQSFSSLVALFVRLLVSMVFDWKAKLNLGVLDRADYYSVSS